MKYKSLALLISLALIGCGGGGGGGGSSSSSEVVEVPDVPESPEAPEVPETPTAPPESGSLEFLASGIPEGVVSVPDVSCTQTFDSISDLEDAVSETMQAGTTLCLADGEYSGLSLQFGGQGTQNAPIKVAAQNSGKAIIKGGEVLVKMAGSNVQLQGLVFEDVTYGSSLIETRFGQQELCHDCRITEVSIINAQAEDESGVLVHLYGKDVWFDHSIVSGKTSASPMISFNRWVDESWDEETKLAELAQGIVVYKNYIANRPPVDGKLYPDSSDNNYEAIRTGVSATHQYPSDSFIVGNLFEQIQGEAEVISNKGTNNVISNNTIRNSYGSLTTRHGGNNTISNNFILGEGYPQSGGIRVVDGGHSITNNYIEGARYKNTSHHGGIVLLGSDGAGDAENGYQQVENVHIAFNTIVDSVNSFNIDGGGKSYKPKEIYFSNNLIDKAIGPVIVRADRGLPEDSFYEGNIVYGQSFSDDDEVSLGVAGFEFSSAELVRADDALYRQSSNTPNIDAVSNYEKGNFADVTLDMDGQERSETTQVGADENLTADAKYRPLNYEDVGPISYTMDKPEPIMVETSIENADFESDLEGWQSSNAVVQANEKSFSGSSLAITNESEVVAQTVDLLPNHDYVLSAFVIGEYRLEVDGIASKQDDSDGDEYSWVTLEFNSGSALSARIELSTTDDKEGAHFDEVRLVTRND